MSEEYLIRNCAPTLAGIKTASLFTCPCPDRQAMLRSLGQWNRRLSGKGLRLLPLRFSGQKALIYLYRPTLLRRDLSQDTALRLLRQAGYRVSSCEDCVASLGRKLRSQLSFPHEIGLFLGYPAEDVRGFMELGPEGCKCTGCWRVYGDEESARKTFAQYRKCTKIYWELWTGGRSMERLTVSR